VRKPIFHGGKLGFEIKYTDYPKVTKSMSLSVEFLKLDQLTVIVPGKENYPLTPQIRVQGLEHYLGLH
jgi:predicted AAA+ superfamily ATPase